MDVIIKRVKPEDENAFVLLSLELTRFNRRLHALQADHFEEVLRARSERALHLIHSAATNQLILIATMGKKQVGYALATVFYSDPSSDHGTELSGLLDEVYVGSR